MFKIEVVNLHVHVASADALKEINQALAAIGIEGRKIMATLDEVKAALAKLAADADAEKAEVATAIGALKDQVQALKDQIAKGNAASPEDLDALLVSLGAIDEQVKGITVPGEEVVPT